MRELRMDSISDAIGDDRESRMYGGGSDEIRCRKQVLLTPESESDVDDRWVATLVDGSGAGRIKRRAGRSSAN